MTDGERAIRELVSTWMRASESGDVNTALSLMADDVIFMVPGREPFGKDVFRAASEAMKNIRLTGSSDVREVNVLGDWPCIRNYIEITITSPEGGAMRVAFSQTCVANFGFVALVLRQLGNAEFFGECRDLSALLVDRFGEFVRAADIEKLPRRRQPLFDRIVGDRADVGGNALP
jgi:uncharacterized protein (TIGR02246 family)